MMLTDVSGAVSGTWDAAHSPYRLTSNAWVSAGTTLEIQPGVTVESAGGYTLEYRAGSLGSITNSLFTTAVLKLSTSTASVSGTTFIGSDPVITLPSLVPELADNTFAASGISTIHVAGTTTASAAWTVMGTASRYTLDSNVTVAAGHTLTLGDGVEIYADAAYDLTINDTGTVSATGSRFAGVADLFVRSGGRLDLSGVTQVDATRVEYQAGSSGNIVGTHFNSAPLKNYSSDPSVTGNVSVSGCTFTSLDPVYTYPSLVPELTDNVFSAAGTSVIHVYGAMTDNAAWTVMGTARRYTLDANVTVGAGKVLTLGEGVEVYADAAYDLIINGTVSATGSRFEGVLDVYVYSGGRLDLSGVTKLDATRVLYYENSSGTILYAHFDSGQLQNYSSNVTVGGCTFTSTDPVVTYPSLVPELVDNTFAGAGTSAIHVWGAMTTDAAWTVMGTARRYTLDANVTVGAGKALTLGDGVEIYAASAYDLTIYGTVTATNSRFEGVADVYVYATGRLDMSGVTKLDATRVLYYENSSGTILNTHFDSAQLINYSSNVTVGGCTFTSTDPVVTYPSLVPELTDNTFAGAGTSAIHVWGAMTTDAAWTVMGTARRYTLDANVTVGAGKALTFGDGVEIYAAPAYDLTIYGTVTATNSRFEGVADVYVYATGRLDMSGVTKLDATRVLYYENSSGTILNTHFDSAQLINYSSNVTVGGCTFTSTDPVVTYPSLVPELVDNTFAGTGISAIHVTGPLTTDATWTVMGTARRYTLDGNVTVGAGKVLTLGTEVDVYAPSAYDLAIYGTVSAANVLFSGAADVFVYSGGVLNLDLALVRGTRVQFAANSEGLVRGTTFASILLEVYDTSLAQFQCNDFSTTNVYAFGNAAGTVSLKENYWGTTDTARIDAERITDHLDSPTTRPRVDYIPLRETLCRFCDLEAVAGSFAAAPAAPFVPGQTITVSYEVRNISLLGDAQATATVFSLYDGAAPQEEVFLGLAATPALAAGATTGVQTISLTLPGAEHPFWAGRLPSTLVLAMQADGTNALLEPDELNNFATASAPCEYPVLRYEVPFGDGSDDLVLRLNGATLEIFDVNADAVVASRALYLTARAEIVGAAGEDDRLTVDFAFGGFFELPQGVYFHGGAGATDTLRIAGGGSLLATYHSRGATLGEALIEVRESGRGTEIELTGVEPVQVAGAAFFDAAGELPVGPQTLTLDVAAFANLGAVTQLAGGSVVAANGVVVAQGRTLMGYGQITAPVAAENGSTITLGGDLTLGAATAYHGFFSDGVLRVGTHTVTLLDRDKAVLGSLTQIGSGGQSGVLSAAKGLLLSEGKTLLGQGEINTVDGQFRNNGFVAGTGTGLTFHHLVTGIGDFDGPITFQGGYSPGLSPAQIDFFGNATFTDTNVLQIELGGTLPGDEFDRLDVAGAASLNGELAVSLIDGFVPAAGDRFEIIMAAGGVQGTFDTETLPALPQGLEWTVEYLADRVSLIVDSIVPQTLIVTSLVSTPSGFVASFNRAVDLSVLNLYDSASQTLGAADVTVTGATLGAIRGSLMFSADQRQATFVQTGGLLEPDTYTVTLFSGATRLRDTSGGALDGNADGTRGDNYQTTFTVSALPAGTVTVSVPDMARGAGQPVNVPAGISGLPIRLDNAAGVRSLAVDLVYDQALLAITATALAAGIPGDWSVDPPDTSTPGVAKIRASGATPLSGTNVDVVRLTAAVPNAAPYGAIQAIRLENVSLNGHAITAVGDVAVHKAVYLGDADGSGIHSSADAFLTVQAALGLASGFAAHSWTDPLIVGDADGSGVLSAADAFLIVQEGLGLAEPFVPDNPQISVTPVGGGVDPQFRIGENLSASVGAFVSVPVMLNIEAAATNVGAWEFDLFFDSTQLTIQLPEDVSAGADTAGWAASATLVAPGQLRVGMVSSNGQPLTPGLREIARLQFRVEPRGMGLRPVQDGLATRPTLLPPITDYRSPITDVSDGSETHPTELDGSETHPTWLDIEPVDPRAGGYTWTEADGSVLIRPAAWAPAGARRERVWRDMDAKADLLESVLADLVHGIASAWR